MTTAQPHESGEPAREAISPDAEFWIRKFIPRLEEHFLHASRTLAQEASLSNLQTATAQAILATFLDSGMDFESVVELLGEVAIHWRSPDVGWTDAMNARRFQLIDKEIEGVLTPAESIELAGLTRTMREHVDSETNLPTEGARELHRKLRDLKSADRPE